MTGKNPTKIIAPPGKQELSIVRTFDAPRELVFKAYTDPNLIPRWWGPRIFTTTVDRMDVRSRQRESSKPLNSKACQAM
jgi:uncharacterized protein YndB with AHSA1/START domain